MPRKVCIPDCRVFLGTTWIYCTLQRNSRVCISSTILYQQAMGFLTRMLPAPLKLSIGVQLPQFSSRLTLWRGFHQEIAEGTSHYIQGAVTHSEWMHRCTDLSTAMPLGLPLFPFNASGATVTVTERSEKHLSDVVNKSLAPLPLKRNIFFIFFNWTPAICCAL